jgi:glutathione S-transferase
VDALNPRGQVPVLVDGDAVICDSTSILEYLEEVVPQPALYPATPAARARCRTLEAFADETFFAPLWDLVEEGFYAAGKGERDERRLAAALRKLAGLHAELDAQLAGREFLCDAYSVADIANFVMLASGASMGAPPDPAHANLAGWLARMAKRPPVAREIGAMQAYAAGLRPAAASA